MLLFMPLVSSLPMDRIPISDPSPVEGLDDVFVGPLLEGDQMSCQSFRIEAGGETDTHSHPHEQLIFVLSGTLTFRIDERTVAVGPDEVILLEGDEPHSVANPGEVPATGLEAFSPPRPKVSEWLAE